MTSLRVRSRRVLAMACAVALAGSVTVLNATAVGAATKGSPLIVGTIESTQGACLNQASNDVPNTANAWAKYVNAHGGVAGHPVKVINYSDNCDAGQSTAAFQKLVAAGALAIIDSTNSDGAWIDAATSAKIPVICGIETGNNPNCFTKSNLFPTGATVLSELYGNVDAAKLAGAKSFSVLYCTENPACAQALPLFKGFASQLGLTYPSPIAAGMSEANYTAPCLAFQQEKAESIFPAGPPADKVAQDCVKQGYHPIITQSAGTWLTRYLKVTALNGSTGTFPNIPWFLNTPATKAFHTAEASVLKTTQTPYLVSGTWGGLNAFALAAKNVGSNPTTADIYTGLYALSGTNLGGFSPTVTYTPGKPGSVSCFFIMSIKNGKFVAPQGAKTSCQPSA